MTVAEHILSLYVFLYSFLKPCGGAEVPDGQRRGVVRISLFKGAAAKPGHWFQWFRVGGAIYNFDAVGRGGSFRKKLGPKLKPWQTNLTSSLFFEIFNTSGKYSPIPTPKNSSSCYTSFPCSSWISARRHPARRK